MFVVLGDTHHQSGHGLTGRTLEAVRAADVVAHTGDFTTFAVYRALAAECTTLHAVAGNNDEPAVASRLPSRTVFEVNSVTFVLVHGHEHSVEARSLLAREVGADVVISGHSHQPAVEQSISCTLLNPGSHAEPRWNRPAHAELEPTATGFEGRLVEPDGSVVERFSIEWT